MDKLTKLAEYFYVEQCITYYLCFKKQEPLLTPNTYWNRVIKEWPKFRSDWKAIVRIYLKRDDERAVRDILKK